MALPLVVIDLCADEPEDGEYYEPPPYKPPQREEIYDCRPDPPGIPPACRSLWRVVLSNGTSDVTKDPQRKRVFRAKFDEFPTHLIEQLLTYLGDLMDFYLLLEDPDDAGSDLAASRADLLQEVLDERRPPSPEPERRRRPRSPPQKRGRRSTPESQRLRTQAKPPPKPKPTPKAPKPEPKPKAEKPPPKSPPKPQQKPPPKETYNPYPPQSAPGTSQNLQNSGGICMNCDKLVDRVLSQSSLIQTLQADNYRLIREKTDLQTELRARAAPNRTAHVGTGTTELDKKWLQAKRNIREVSKYFGIV